MANRVPDPREMLKECRSVRRSTTRYDIVQVCEELERRLLLDLKVDPPDGRFPGAAAPVAPVAAHVAVATRAATKAVSSVSKPRANAANAANKKAGSALAG